MVGEGQRDSKGRMLSREEPPAWGLGTWGEGAWGAGGATGTSSEGQPQKALNQADLYFRTTQGSHGGDHLGSQVAEGEVALS